MSMDNGRVRGNHRGRFSGGWGQFRREGQSRVAMHFLDCFALYSNCVRENDSRDSLCG